MFSEQQIADKHFDQVIKERKLPIVLVFSMIIPLTVSGRQAVIQNRKGIHKIGSKSKNKIISGGFSAQKMGDTLCRYRTQQIEMKCMKVNGTQNKK
uniref:Uncharacterized protein n=1 Tax=Arion vulgaris TaxID=1028688 RepID=A0A0B6YYC6_9EUPU